MLAMLRIDRKCLYAAAWRSRSMRKRVASRSPLGAKVNNAKYILCSYGQGKNGPVDKGNGLGNIALMHEDVV